MYQIPPSEPKSNNTLYVGDLEPTINENVLHGYFVKFGPVSSLRILKDIYSKQSRGFAFVSYYNHNDALNAKNQANHQIIFSKPIRVTWQKKISELSAENNIFVKNIPLQVTEIGTQFTQILKELYQSMDQFFHPKFQLTNKDSLVAMDMFNMKTKRVHSNAYSRLPSIFLDILWNVRALPVGLIVVKQTITISISKIFQKSLQLKQNLNQEVLFISLAICSQFGDVISILAKEDQNGRPFAFICFKDKEQAKNAFTELQNKDIFGAGEPIYVNWAMKKSDRVAMLQKEHAHSVNETNLFTKGIKDSVTLEDFKAAFNTHGEVVSCVIRKPTLGFIKTQFGFVSFKDKQTSFRCLIDGVKNPQIQSLYENNKVYLNIAMSKARYDQFRKTKQAHQLNYLKSQRIPQIDNKMVNSMSTQMQSMSGNFLIVALLAQGQMMSQMQALFPQMQNFNSRMQHMGRPNYGIYPHGTQKRQNHPGSRNNSRNKSQPKEQEKKFATIQQVNQELAAFTVQSFNKALDIQKQRTILGELLYPLIKELVSDQSQTPRITGTVYKKGMLIDLEVFEISDIIEIINTKTLLQERITEALELIKQEA